MNKQNNQLSTHIHPYHLPSTRNPIKTLCIIFQETLSYKISNPHITAMSQQKRLSSSNKAQISFKSQHIQLCQHFWDNYIPITKLYFMLKHSQYASVQKLFFYFYFFNNFLLKCEENFILFFLYNLSCFPVLFNLLLKFLVLITNYYFNLSI